MQDDDQTIDGSAEEIPPEQAPEPPHPPAAQGAELIHRPVGSTELIRAASAEDRVAQATEIATALDKVIRAQGMRTKVGSQKKLDPATGEAERDQNGRDIWVPRWHVNVEGWQTLATLLGLAVVPLSPFKIIDPATGQPERVRFTVHERQTKGQGQNRTVTEREYEVDGYSWGCRVEVFKDGTLIGAGESVCSRTEQRWKDADDYAVMGMAQTRATSRAIGAAARWIVTLAGYSATPAEEMPADAHDAAPAGQAFGPVIEDGQRALVFEALKALIELDQEPAAVAALPPVQEVAQATAKAITHQLGYMPLAVGKALLAIANAREGRKSAALDAQAAAATTAGDLPAVQEARAAWEPGTVFIEGEKVVGIARERAHIVTAATAKEICTCAGGFDAVEGLDIRQRTEQAGVNTACPLRSHGIPF